MENQSKWKIAFFKIQLQRNHAFNLVQVRTIGREKKKKDIIHVTED